MSTFVEALAPGASVTLTTPEVNNILNSRSSSYSVLEFIGEGVFGKVARCQNLATKEMVAVKIIKDNDSIEDIKEEVSTLELIRVLNPDRSNMVKFFEQFEYMGVNCLVFEMLDKNLYAVLREQHFKPLSLGKIRPIAKQLLVALDTLWNVGVLHTDIKPDNVMFVNIKDQPLRVKLTDFGAAIRTSEVQPGMHLQSTGFRAPEIALGLPFTEAIDVWGVGCILVFLYLGKYLFPVDCDFQMMRRMVDVLGQPEDHLLHAGYYTDQFFFAYGPTWRLRTPKEYRAANQEEPLKRHRSFDQFSSLDDLINIHPKGGRAQFEDRWAFVELLKRLLHIDGYSRITAYRALQQPFVTMAHLTAPGSTDYLRSSLNMMRVCTVEDSADEVPTIASLPSPCPEKDSDAWLSEGELLSDSSDEDPDVSSCEGEGPSDSSDEDPDASSCDGEHHSDSSDEDVQEKIILSKYYTELQEPLKCSQETTAAELQEEREKKKLLQEEFDKEAQEKNILKRSQETTDAELQAEREKKKLLQEELERVKVSYNEQLLRCETDLDDIKQQAELQQEVAEVSNVQQLNNSLPNAPALESIQEEAEIFEEKLPATTPKTPSFFKRVRHFLGLRKPQRWKKKKEE